MRLRTSAINLGLTFTILIMLMTTIGCSGGGGGGDGSGNTPLTGVFLDSPVDGLGYETDTIHGVTGPGGVFSYHSGESIRFFIGDIELGATEAMPIITPIDCVEGAIDETDPMVTNMLIFLQSIDFDNDPENGIDITEFMHQEAIGMHLVFSGDPNEFRENYDFRNFLDRLSTMGMFYDYGDRLPPEIELARFHMQETMIENGLHGYGPGSPNGNNMMPYYGNDGQQSTDNMSPGRGPHGNN